MIWWLVDNAGVIYFLLGLALVVAGLVFWQTRRGRDLLAMAIFVGLGALLWLLTSLVVTDRKQIRDNMYELADAALRRRPERIEALLSRSFAFGNLERADIPKMVVATAKHHGVYNCGISSFEIDQLSKSDAGGQASAGFNLAVNADDGTLFAVCKATFVWENGEWLLSKLEMLDKSGQPIPVGLNH